MDPVGRESRSRAHLVENLAARRALVLMLEDRARALAEPRGMRPLIAHCHLGLGRLYPHWKARARPRAPHDRDDDVPRDGRRREIVRAGNDPVVAAYATWQTVRKEVAMPRYVVLYRFTAEGAKNLRETVKRARQTREQTEKRGFKVQTLLWTQGPYDLVSIIDAPSEEAMMGAMTNVVTAGNVSSTTMRAFDDKEMEGIQRQG